MSIEFTVENGRMLDVFDPIMRHRATLSFPSPIDPRPADPEDFVFPVDRAITFRTSGLHQQIPMIFAFDGDGHKLDNIDPSDVSRELPAGEYYFSLREAVKIYLRVDSPTDVTITFGDNELNVDFGTETQVTLGVRSLHERPEATVTTTEAPEDVMAAVSTLSSALKDVGPMRSFVTLRGCPPELSLGDELHIPDVIETPDTGIRLELPPERRYAFAAAPLAYYLGAEVVPSDDPKITTEAGTDFPLDEGWNIEQELNRILRRNFFLDSLVRRDDPYCPEYPGRPEFEEETGISLDGLYELSPAERLDAYLEIPQSVFDRFGLNWPYGARISPNPETIEHLPSLAHGLTMVHPVQGKKVGDSMRDLAAPDDPTRGTPIFSFDDVTDETVIDPEPIDTARQMWVGPGTPMGAEKPDIDAIRRGYDRDPIEGDIDYVVVCNDERMLEENEEVQELLDEHAGFSFSIETYQGVTVGEFREILSKDIEVLHFVGHADENGFVCPDGYLDAADLETVGADVFFLNSCLSSRQGKHILEAGAIAGIVTLGEVRNEVATRVGQRVALLLNHGLPVGGALELATELTDSADRYTAIGDTSFQVVFSDLPGIDTLVQVDDDRVVHSYHLSTLSFLGSYITRLRTDMPAEADVGIPLFDATGIGFRCVHERDEYFTQLNAEDVPIWVDGELRHSTELDPDTLEI